MLSFIICLVLLIGGYFVYGNIVNNIFSPDDRETPAVKINDGVDYVVMPSVEIVSDPVIKYRWIRTDLWVALQAHSGGLWYFMDHIWYYYLRWWCP